MARAGSAPSSNAAMAAIGKRTRAKTGTPDHFSHPFAAQRASTSLDSTVPIPCYARGVTRWGSVAALIALVGCGQEVIGEFSERPDAVVVGFGGLRAASFDGGASFPTAGLDTPRVGAEIRDVIVSGDRFVAAGAAEDGGGGAWWTTADGLSWETFEGPPTPVNALASGPEGIVMVDEAGDATLAEPNGTVIARFETSARDWLGGVVWGDDRYVLVGDDGKAHWSTDGREWIIGYTVGPRLVDIAYGNGVFVAVGDNGLRVTSPDGAEVLADIQAPDDPWIYDVEFADGGFVAVGPALPVGSGMGWVYRSEDGISWAQTGIDLAIESVAFVGEDGWLGSDGSALYRSPDLERWEPVAIEAPVSIEGIAVAR